MQNKLLAAKAALPDYDRTKLVPRIVHLGFGVSPRNIRGFTLTFWLPTTAVTGATAK